MGVGEAVVEVVRAHDRATRKGGLDSGSPPKTKPLGLGFS